MAQVAQRYGGGGHRNAAGFSVSLAAWLRDFVPAAGGEPGGSLPGGR